VENFSPLSQNLTSDQNFKAPYCSKFNAEHKSSYRIQFAFHVLNIFKF
jgi:hypothetical protein